MKLWVCFNDCCEHNIICISADRAICDKAFDDYNAALIARGFKPNPETDRGYLVREYPITGDIPIHLIWAGWYSDKDVVGVCTNDELEDAEKLIDRLNLNDHPSRDYFHITQIKIGFPHGDNLTKTGYIVTFYRLKSQITEYPNNHNEFYNIDEATLDKLMTPKIRVVDNEDIDTFNEYGLTPPSVERERYCERMVLVDGQPVYRYTYKVTLFANGPDQAMKIAEDALAQFLYENEIEESPNFGIFKRRT